jgi:hypothetical protein
MLTDSTLLSALESGLSTRLQQLKLDGCPTVTDEVIQFMINGCPNLAVRLLEAFPTSLLLKSPCRICLQIFVNNCQAKLFS